MVPTRARVIGKAYRRGIACHYKATRWSVEEQEGRGMAPDGRPIRRSAGFINPLIDPAVQDEKRLGRAI